MPIAASISWFFWTPPLATPVHWGAEPFRMGDSADGVTQERYFFFWFTRFTRYWQHEIAGKGEDPILDFGWCQDGIEQRKQGIAVAASHTVGMHGFCLEHRRQNGRFIGHYRPAVSAHAAQSRTKKLARWAFFARSAGGLLQQRAAQQQ
ncbi:MAG: hypothetical protein IPN27_11235 [Cellvibrionales bacterium]|nr:hypothetical protein [Cellvibrionales bacterium]